MPPLFPESPEGQKEFSERLSEAKKVRVIREQGGDSKASYQAMLEAKERERIAAENRRIADELRKQRRAKKIQEDLEKREKLKEEFISKKETTLQRIAPQLTPKYTPLSQEQREQGFYKRVYNLQERDKKYFGSAGMGRIREFAGAIAVSGRSDLGGGGLFPKGTSTEIAAGVIGTPFYISGSLLSAGGKIGATAEALTISPTIRKETGREYLRAVGEIPKSFDPTTPTGAATLVTAIGTAGFLGKYRGGSISQSKTLSGGRFTEQRAIVKQIEIQESGLNKPAKVIGVGETSLNIKGLPSQFGLRKQTFKFGGEAESITTQTKYTGGKIDIPLQKDIRIGFDLKGGQLQKGAYQSRLTFESSKQPAQKVYIGGTFSGISGKGGGIFASRGGGTTATRQFTTKSIFTTKRIGKNQFVEVTKQSYRGITKEFVKGIESKPTLIKGGGLSIKLQKPKITITKIGKRGQFSLTQERPTSPIKIESPKAIIGDFNLASQLKADISGVGKNLVTSSIRAKPLLTSVPLNIFKEETIISTKIATKQIQTPATKTITSQTIKPTQKIGTIQESITSQPQITKQITEPLLDIPITPTPIAPSFNFGRFILPSGNLLGGSLSPKRKIYRRKVKQPKRRTPTAFAFTFGIKGQRNPFGELTGLGVRPLLSKPKKKKRRRK